MNTKMNLTLTAIESPLNGLVLIELVDEIALNKLVHSDLLKNDDDWNEKLQLTKYSEKVKNGKVEVLYCKPKGMLYGRSNACGNLGLHTIRREIRHTIAKDYFVDIDIENCHPVLLYQICEANGIESVLLKDYVQNRKRYLQMVMDHLLIFSYHVYQLIINDHLMT